MNASRAIVCGFDFSAASDDAAVVAAGLAWGDVLVLVHAIVRRAVDDERPRLRLLHGSSEQGLLRLTSTNLLVVPAR